MTATRTIRVNPGAEVRPLVACASISGNVHSATLHSLLDRGRPPTARSVCSGDQNSADLVSGFSTGRRHSHHAGIGTSRIASGVQPLRVTSPISASLHATSARACVARTHAYRMSHRRQRGDYRSTVMAPGGFVVVMPFVVRGRIGSATG